jgi:hypothetical protein
MRTFRLGLACDNRCVFCAADGLAEPASAESWPDGDAITFIGGEPLLADLEAAVITARAKGFRTISVQTNARTLDPDRARRLAGLGLTAVHVTLLGPTAAPHDYHTGVPGSFAATLAGAAAARAAGLTIACATVLTRSNMRVLGAMPQLLGQRGFAAWLVELPRAAGRAAPAFDRVMPRLALAVPFALHAIEAARRLGVPSWIRGAPLCLLGPLADRSLPEHEPRAYAAPCESCPAKPSCPGVDGAYLDRFGGGELSPREPQPAPEPTALQALFVGPGELAARPAPRNRSLPIADGRPRPGKQEVPSSAPKKSGAELFKL